MGKFMAYVGQLFELVGGKGRITWTLDLGRWSPTKRNQDQDPKAWRCVFVPDDPAAEPTGRSASDGADALLALLVALKRAADHPEDAPTPRAPMSPERLEAVIAFARETWRDDGAEGETVHALCDALERARSLALALDPFARYAAALPPIVPGAQRLTDAGVALSAKDLSNPTGPEAAVTFADLRRAKAALDANGWTAVGPLRSTKAEALADVPRPSDASLPFPVGSHVMHNGQEGIVEGLQQSTQIDTDGIPRGRRVRFANGIRLVHVDDLVTGWEGAVHSNVGAVACVRDVIAAPELVIERDDAIRRALEAREHVRVLRGSLAMTASHLRMSMGLDALTEAERSARDPIAEARKRLADHLDGIVRESLEALPDLGDRP